VETLTSIVKKLSSHFPKSYISNMRFEVFIATKIQVMVIF